ncbi:MAG TPA: hypothetical protein VM865_02605 [Acidobacteriaceae bacterium]|jgi:hypothetical protein|nr:hypothetical protein [Acidobacteriaceae bacterium]
MLKIAKAVLCALAVSVFVPTLANAAPRATWSPWTALPNTDGVAVSFSQVNESMCTWMIRNTGSSTLRHLEFTYTYSSAVQQGQTTGRDLLLQPLKPGRLTGGATQFGAETGSCPATLEVKHIEWAHR